MRADRDGPFGAAARPDRVTLNLGQILIYPVDGRSQSFSLSFASMPRGFREALALESLNGGYRAASYDRLIDTPVLLGDFKEARFEVAGKTIRVVAHGAEGTRRLRELRGGARKIVKAAHRLMGALPFEQYTFVYVFSDQGGGGMEYRNGTLIFSPPDCEDCALDELTAHEFFHLWNVKRIRPASMEPVRFDRPVASPSLWFAEGVTSTYAQYLLISAGLVDAKEALLRLEERIDQYEDRPARLTQSAEESSIDAWLEGDPAYHRPDRSLSYYLQGELIGHLLDLEIRGRTANRRSLDDLIGRLSLEHAMRGRYFEDTAELEEIASEVAGSDMSAVFDELVRTASPVDWDRYLRWAGYRLELLTAGEKPAPGLTLADPPGHGVVVSSVTPGGPADAAGFQVGDRILQVAGQAAVAGAAATTEQLSVVDGRGAVSVLIRRGALPLPLQLRPSARDRLKRHVVSLAELSEEQRAVREGWLSRRTVDDSVR